MLEVGKVGEVGSRQGYGIWKYGKAEKVSIYIDVEEVGKCRGRED